MSFRKIPGVALKYLPELVADFNTLTASENWLFAPKLMGGGCIGSVSFRGRCDCDGIRCDECILHRSGAFINYIQKHEYVRTNRGWMKMNYTVSENCPRILSGDLFKTTDGCWYVSLNDTFAYRISCGATIVLIEGLDLLDSLSEPIVEVHRHERGAFMQSEFLDVIRKNWTACLIWKRKEVRPVVEMTVDEVSDKLGVTVKIVGDKHAKK